MAGDTAEARLQKILDVVLRWLTPDGISSGSAMVEITGLVDPMPTADPISLAPTRAANTEE